MSTLTVHFFAAARAAAGVPTLTLDAGSHPTLASLLDQLASTHTGATPSGQTLASILPRCSFLLDGTAATPTSPLAGATRLDVLPPFAGG